MSDRMVRDLLQRGAHPANLYDAPTSWPTERRHGLTELLAGGHGHGERVQGHGETYLRWPWMEVTGTAPLGGIWHEELYRAEIVTVQLPREPQREPLRLHWHVWLHDGTTTDAIAWYLVQEHPSCRRCG